MLPHSSRLRLREDLRVRPEKDDHREKTIWNRSLDYFLDLFRTMFAGRPSHSPHREITALEYAMSST
jgi:hypothetical protein